MSNNALFGTVPAQLDSMPSLRVLALANNRLSGTIPNAAAFTLNSLDLSGNVAINGSLPVAAPVALGNLNLAGTSVSGAIPQGYNVSNAAALTELNLQGTAVSAPCAAATCLPSFIQVNTALPPVFVTATVVCAPLTSQSIPQLMLDPSYLAFNTCTCVTGYKVVPPPVLSSGLPNCVLCSDGCTCVNGTQTCVLKQGPSFGLAVGMAVLACVIVVLVIGCLAYCYVQRKKSDARTNADTPERQTML
eukprot:TRINITY_DN6086_c0_g1_i2.p1 TRINITY_DN6086_c0_g1~~TRINITY_DN6086_c0_g1_i2.p1  ORF type:complete len:247 (-),score=57.28 TRINITY_DN6086_c0_g1_i2:75-815(-)